MGLGERGHTLRAFIDDAAHGVFGVIAIVMKAAPVGAFGAMAFTIGKFGTGAILNLIGLIATFYLTAALFVFVVLGIIARIVGFSIFKFLAYIKDELLIVLGTSSSESALPSLMEKLETARLFQVGRRPGGADRIFVQSRWHEHLYDARNPVHCASAGFRAYLRPATNHPAGGDADLEGGVRHHGSGLYHARRDAGRCRSAFGARHGHRSGHRQVHERMPRPDQPLRNGVACVVVSWWEGELDHDKLHANLNKQNRSVRHGNGDHDGVAWGRNHERAVKPARSNLAERCLVSGAKRTFVGMATSTNRQYSLDLIRPTSSARPSIDGGTMSPSTFAVLRLIFRSNRVGS